MKKKKPNVTWKLEGAEAARQWFKGETLGDVQSLTDIIQAAIEKATAEAEGEQRATEAAYEMIAAENRQLRAAQARERKGTCQNCGANTDCDEQYCPDCEKEMTRP
jgi:hypothetical protein